MAITPVEFYSYSTDPDHISNINISRKSRDANVSNPPPSQEAWASLQSPTATFSLLKIFYPLSAVIGDSQRSIVTPPYQDSDLILLLVALSSDDFLVRSRAAQDLGKMRELTPDDADAATASLMATIRKETAPAALRSEMEALLAINENLGLETLQNHLNKLKGMFDQWGHRAIIYEILAAHCGEKGIQLIVEDFNWYYDSYNSDPSYPYEAWRDDEEKLFETLTGITDKLDSATTLIANIIAEKGLASEDIEASSQTRPNTQLQTTPNYTRLQSRLNMIKLLNAPLSASSMERIRQCYEQENFPLARQAQRILERQAPLLASNTILSEGR